MRRALGLIGIAIVGLLAVASRASALPLIDTFPGPNAQYAQPHTQLTFRGEPLADMDTADITVRGSKTGVHTGRWESDSDNLGGSFFPSKPFDAGETVTVFTKLNVEGVSNGIYGFKVAVPAGIVHGYFSHNAPRKANDVLHFSSRPDLTPAHIFITKNSSAAPPGDIFLAPQHGPVQNGPMIISSSGQLIWFKPLSGIEEAEDFRTQSYQGKPVLTYWEGVTGEGVGVGRDVILNSAYHEVAEVKAGNGLRADLHEFQLTPQGNAWIDAVYPVRADASSVHGSKNQDVFDDVIQEIDVKTGLVLFQWDSLDHVPLSDSYVSPNTARAAPYDYFHANTIDIDYDGTILISARNTWADYKINPITSQTIWTLGGKQSSWKLGPGARFYFQHDVRIGNQDKRVTMFDDGGGPPRPEPDSRGLVLALNAASHTATVVRSYRHSPALSTDAEGNLQVRPDGDALIGWGQEPYFSEYGGAGQLLLDGHFDAFNSSYRVYRFPWTGQPTTLPAIWDSHPGGHTLVRASWNGATTVARWRLIGGGQIGKFKPLRSVPKTGFETSIEVSGKPAGIQVQALSASGKVLGTSKVLGHPKPAAKPEPTKPKPYHLAP